MKGGRLVECLIDARQRLGHSGKEPGRVLTCTVFEHVSSLTNPTDIDGIDKGTGPWRNWQPGLLDVAIAWSTATQ